MNNQTIAQHLAETWSKLMGISLAIDVHNGSESFAVKIDNRHQCPEIIRARAHMTNAVNFIDSTVYAFEKAFSQSALYEYIETEALVSDVEKRTTPYIVAEAISKLGTIRDSLVQVCVDQEIEIPVQEAIKEISDRLECARANLLIADKILSSENLVKVWKAE